MSIKKITGGMLSVALLLLSSVFGGISFASADAISDGKKVAFDRKKGNCLACHMMSDGQSPGNIGPPLIAMKARFPDKAVLRAQIWDATAKNAGSMMPPFGKHRILTEKEVDLVTEFVYSL